jgi:glycosidase
MLFTNNHDFNSWHGTDRELYGAAYKPLAVLAATLPGMPLVYSGQESGLDKRLAFFEKDQIAWKNYPLEKFYAGLLAFKRANPALMNGQYGAPLEMLETGNDKVFAFRRGERSMGVQVLANLSPAPQTYLLAGQKKQTLAPWAYKMISTRMSNR